MIKPHTGSIITAWHVVGVHIIRIYFDIQDFIRSRALIRALLVTMLVVNLYAPPSASNLTSAATILPPLVAPQRVKMRNGWRLQCPRIDSSRQYKALWRKLEAAIGLLWVFHSERCIFRQFRPRAEMEEQQASDYPMESSYTPGLPPRLPYNLWRPPGRSQMCRKGHMQSVHIPRAQGHLGRGLPVHVRSGSPGHPGS